jgi:hypothetical protein
MGALQTPYQIWAGAIAFPVAAARPAMTDEYAFPDEHKLNWNRAKLRQKTCIDESIMLPFLATLRIVYWQAMPLAQ